MLKHHVIHETPDQQHFKICTGKVLGEIYQDML